ncbi:hypothetical protein BDW02DRAFT_325050 [Decorospora gaudefroyi]|uniref:Uncharacterized protein n=1 Tax=Decorospora gaudefroyi TaxID=184978 RepID=A0A6A5KGG2_9PLEO|nr:hypothetical protein BDW02DRAFT_325050 [Decorospora gaudefroyi]
MDTTNISNVCIPMHLDAFVLSPPSCGTDLKSKIAPFTQPNYIALRLDGQFLRHDLLDHADFHLAQPATRNPRVANIGAVPPDNLKLHRLGVHLQWSLPKLYRTATASGRESTPTHEGRRDTSESQPDPSQPVFRKIPNRWLITRRLKNLQDAPPGFPEFQSWMVESDVVRNIKTIDPDVDLESDVSPFVSYKGDASDTTTLNAQTEVFLGQKFDLASWPGKGNREYLKPGLTLMSSSNPLFGDYALHNCNVLSMIDNFSYTRDDQDGNPTDEISTYLSKAHCDYFVIGWHHSADADPLNSPMDPEDVANLSTRLSDLFLKLSPEEAGETGKFKDAKDATRSLVHGAIYDVVYDFHDKPERILAEEGAQMFIHPSKKATTGPRDKTQEWIQDEKMEPLSVGTTPLDAMLAFLDAHKDDSDESSVFGPGASALSHNIIQLAQLLYAAADGYDARVQAQDLIAQQNFSRTEGGTNWTYARGDGGNRTGGANDGKPKIPSDNERQSLRELNEKQLQYDICARKLRALRWELFAEWFKFKTEFLPEVGKNEIFQFYREKVNPTLDEIVGTDPPRKASLGLLRFMRALREEIESLKEQVDCKESTKEPFQTRQDPTLCIAGLDSGWPTDVMETLQVRLDEELTDDTSQVGAIFGSSESPVPQHRGLRDTAAKILAECLKESNVKTENGLISLPRITGFQAWGNRNPFVPLFIEWEAMYYHIDKNTWDVQLRPSPVGHPHPQFRYCLGDKLLLSDPEKNSKNQKDRRTLSGRAVVLPQPRFSLQDIVIQVLDSKSPEIPEDLDTEALKKQMQQIKFISAPLSGLANHLLTRCEGAHVKPNVRVQGETVIPLAAADASEINMGIENLALVDSESTLTPYGSLMSFGVDEYPENPFKPVTHGQMLLTKLNIIDKFGQAICLPYSNRRRVRETVPPNAGIYPCLSENLTPDILKASPNATEGTLNTVYPTPPTTEGQWPLCQFMQLTPSINQDARINASFLIRDTISKNTYSPWRETTDYESPIWGWLVINYADNGLQFFLGDGTFYREIRKGGVQGTNVSAKWLPYDPPPMGLEPTDAGTHQLDGLLKMLSPEVDTDGSYLQAFFNMINGAVQNMPFPPSSYAGYANAIVGKPLALVNVGWSIELAEPPIKPQFDSLSKRPEDWKGLLERYTFELKIGDRERNYDGVVGFFHSSNSGSNSSEPQTDWDTLYTYFPPEKPHAKFKELKDEYPLVSPYYIHLDLESTPDITFAMNRKYFITSMLIDPYTPIHGYSPILPQKSISIAPWAIQSSMDKLHAFFHLGPLLHTVDVPPTYEEAAAKKEDGSVQCVRLPVSGQKGTWTWLQPYEQEGEAEDGTARPAQFAEMGVVEDLGAVKWEKAPYTFLEGYLQLMGRLEGNSKV